jgi:hypothetical protein
LIRGCQRNSAIINLPENLTLCWAGSILLTWAYLFLLYPFVLTPVNVIMSLNYVFLLDGVEAIMLEKYIIKRKDNTDLNVYRCGFEECSPGYAWGPAIRDHFIIHYVHSGRAPIPVRKNLHHPSR